jgi:Acyl-ACP thioesterase
MTDILSQKQTIRSEQVDARRILKTSALLLILQEIALDHSRLLGFGSDATLHRNLLWVVTRYCMDINRLPAYEETVTVETWPGPVRRVLFPRYFRIKDQAGNVIMRASSVWVLIDGEKRSMISPAQYGLTPAEGRTEPDELPYHEPALPIEAERTVSFTVPYSYLDLNGHMNNTRYFDLCEDMIADEVQSSRIRHITAEYLNEVRYKETIEIGVGRLNNDYTFTGKGVKQYFRIGMRFDAAEE